jgi:hypothetical protein
MTRIITPKRLAQAQRNHCVSKVALPATTEDYIMCLRLRIAELEMELERLKQQEPPR